MTNPPPCAPQPPANEAAKLVAVGDRAVPVVADTAAAEAAPWLETLAGEDEGLVPRMDEDAVFDDLAWLRGNIKTTPATVTR